MRWPSIGRSRALNTSACSLVSRSILEVTYSVTWTFAGSPGSTAPSTSAIATAPIATSYSSVVWTDSWRSTEGDMPTQLIWPAAWRSSFALRRGGFKSRGRHGACYSRVRCRVESRRQVIAGTNRNRPPKRQRPELAPAPALMSPRAQKTDDPLKPTVRVVLIRFHGDTVEFVEERFRTWSEF